MPYSGIFIPSTEKDKATRDFKPYICIIRSLFPIMKIRLLLLLLLLFSPDNELSAISCRTYTVKSGLSENTVRRIMQDQTGYMWFATKDGLNRFNGKDFTTYGCPPSSDMQKKNIPHLNILDLLQHRDGIRIWVAARDGVLLFNPISETFEPLNIEYEKHRPVTEAQALCYDQRGHLWIGTGSGLFIYDEDQHLLNFYKHSSDSPNSLPSNNVTSLLCDSQGTIWIGTGNGIARYNRTKDDFSVFRSPSNSGNGILCISEDSNGVIWIGTWYGGFARFNPAKGTFHYFGQVDPSGCPIPRVRDIFHENDASMWICSDIGLFRFDKQTLQLDRKVLSPQLAHNSIYDCYRDREGSLWIGTYFNGVCYIPKKYEQIEWYHPLPGSDVFTGGAISEFCEEANGRIWVASENGGISLFNPETKKFIPTPHHLVDDNIHALAISDNYLWLGTFSKGLRRIDLNSGHTRTYLKSDHKFSIPDNHIYALHKGSDGKLYIGTMHGCAVYHADSDSFTHIDSLKRNFIYDITEDDSGNIWFADYGRGLHRFNRTDSIWYHYRHSADTTSLCNDRVIRLYIDSRSQLWICTEGGGFCLYDYEHDYFRRPYFASKKNDWFPCNVIFGILDDAKGRLWLSSNQGLIRYDPTDGSYRQFTFEDGLQSNQFNYRSSFKASDGKFYFGGIDGFNAFYPLKIMDNDILPTVTAEVRFEKPTNRNKIQSLKIHTQDKVVIPNNVSVFTVNFECLSYVAPDKNHFAYRLNDHTEWTITDQQSISFVDLSPGDYTIRVRSINGDAYWSANECVIQLSVEPPFYLTLTARILYLLLFCSLSMLTVWKWLTHRNRKIQQRIREIELEKEQESYEAKILFFTQIAHEIKTPLSLIKGPLEIIREHQKWDSETESNITIIEKNTQRLLDLINQLLDFKKISHEGYKLHWETIDICRLIDSVVTRFQSAAQRPMQITKHLPEQPIFCVADSEAVTKIISNLLTNALKFSKDTIDIFTTEIDRNSKRFVQIAVRDNGPGIPKSERQRIFDTFYQVSDGETPHRKPGVGLGLSLVKMLTEKHNGQVYIDDKYTDGCEIRVELPSQTDVLQQQPVVTPSTKEIENKSRLLLVEDHIDLLEFLRNSLDSTYTIYTATDGKKALEILARKNMDIIVSDISMPEINGFALLKEVRSNTMLCHIPFILLSAENSLESKIKGLDQGADAYIEKPFSVSHLRATIENLQHNRLLLQKRFSSDPLKKYSHTSICNQDLQWLQQVDTKILSNLNDGAFTIDLLADSLCMGRSNFQRKLKGLTGMPPNDYIRLIRLKQAAKLLSEGHYRINEVCYIVGFCNPSYFANCFQKQFGILPKDFLQKLEKNAPK